jgi:hypothetical protein
MKYTTRMFSLAIAAAMCLSTSYASAAVITHWTFETSLPTGAAAAGVVNGPWAAEIGTGSATGLHAAASTYSNPAGNGSAESYSSTAWAVGDYYQFQTSTTGLTGIGVQFDQTSSGTGPGVFGLFYSTDGTNFTQFGSNYSVFENGASPNASWNSTTYGAGYTTFQDLSSIAALNNQANVYFRLQVQTTATPSGGTIAAGGTSRVDNFIVTSPPAPTVIPEPSTFLLGAFGVVGLVGVARRRKAV